MFIFLTDVDKAEEVRKFVIRKTGLNPAAFIVKVIDKIPRNDSGKIQYTELKQYFIK